MKIMYVVFLTGVLNVCSNNSMERISEEVKIRPSNQKQHALSVIKDEKMKSSSYPENTQTSLESSESSQAEDLESGHISRHKKTSSIVIDSSKKHHLSLKLDMEQMHKDHIESLEIDLHNDNDDSDGICHDALCKQMARDLLKIVYNKENAHKKYKHIRARLQKVLKEKHLAPRNDNEKQQIDYLRKFSKGQLNARLEAKKAKENEQSPTPIPVNRDRQSGSSSPRDLFLSLTSEDGDTVYSELRKLLEKELAKAVKDESNKKLISYGVGLVGTVASAVITWLLTHYTTK